MPMKRVNFPSLVADGENPRAHCVAIAPDADYFDGVVRYPQGLYPDGAEASVTGPRWRASGEVLLAAMAPSLKPPRRGL